LSKKLHIRQFPKLQFIVDTSIQEGFEMVSKLNALEAQEKSLQENNQEE